MNNKDFVAEVSKRLGYTQKETSSLMAALSSVVTEQLENDKNVSIPNFGSFEVKKNNERVIINPSTQQKMLVPPKLVINFKPTNTLKEKMQ